MIAAHPGGCELKHMEDLKRFASKELKISPEQVQIYTPLPSTYSALMYYTGRDPFTDQPIFVERDTTAKIKQKEILTAQTDRRAGKAVAKPKKRITDPSRKQDLR